MTKTKPSSIGLEASDDDRGGQASAERNCWVELHQIALRAGERAPQVPADTAAVALEMRIKGFLLAPARLGQRAEVRTPAGRRVSGTLVSINPPHEHGFGSPVPELSTVGSELRSLLSARDERDEVTGDET